MGDDDDDDALNTPSFFRSFFFATRALQRRAPMHALHLHNEFDHPVAAKQQPMHRPTIISHKMRVSLGGGIRRGVSTSRRPPIFVKSDHPSVV